MSSEVGLLRGLSLAQIAVDPPGHDNLVFGLLPHQWDGQARLTPQKAETFFSTQSTECHERGRHRHYRKLGDIDVLHGVVDHKW